MNSDFAQDIFNGLTAKPKYLSSKYFYDTEGSRLFQQIMHLNEYYLTDCEFEILTIYKDKLLKIFQEDIYAFDLIELGAGDGLKTKILLRHFVEQKQPFIYQPIDISGSVLEILTEDLKSKFNDRLQIKPQVGEYFEALEKLEQHINHRKIVLFLGSNIGNFNYETALSFLQHIRQFLQKDDLLLIGFDLQKNPHTILNAYNDSQGITKAFNLNLLHRINRELKADFDTNAFLHYPVYDIEQSCAKSYLVSTKVQTVHIKELNLKVDFEAWEAIYMEVSNKYSFQLIAQMAQATGFEVVENFTDEKQYFADSLWRVLE